LVSDKNLHPISLQATEESTQGTFSCIFIYHCPTTNIRFLNTLYRINLNERKRKTLLYFSWSYAGKADDQDIIELPDNGS